MSFADVRRVVPLLVALAGVTPAFAGHLAAQTADSVTVRVRQVSGQNVYLDIGSRHGLATGDTVQVFRGEAAEPLGRVTVVAASEERSVLAFVESAFAIEAGESIRLGLLRPPEMPLPDDATPRVNPPIQALSEAPTQTQSVGSRRPAYGRISAEVTGLQSTTRVGGSDPIDIDRAFATPSLRLDLTVPDAVWGFELRTSGRFAYRYSDPDIVEPAASTRIYAASLYRRFESVPLEAEVGRFRNSSESFSGYTDGIALRVGDRALGAGAVAGFQPDRWNEGVSFERPKFVLFADGEQRGEGWWWRGDVSAHFVGGNELTRDRRFAGLSQRASIGRLRISHDVQVDQDPEGGELSLSYVRVQGAVDLSKGWTVRAGATRRQKYREPVSEPAFGSAASRLQFDLSHRGPAGGFGLGVSTGSIGGGGRTTTYQAYADTPSLPSLEVAGQIRGSFTSSENGNTLSLAPSVVASIGGGRMIVGYRLYRSDWASRLTTRHGADISLDIPLFSQVRANIQVIGGFSEVLRSEQVGIRLTRTF